MVLSAQAVTGHARLNNITPPPYSMELTSFFNLLRSGDDDNLELAWQIAQGLKDSREQFFIDFIQSVEFLSEFHNVEDDWFFDDEESIKYSFPDVLYVICEGRINLTNFNKNSFPECFNALSELINRVYFENLKSKVTPKGLDILTNVNYVNAHLNNSIPVSFELFKMPKLDKLCISSSRSDIHISPDIVKCSNLEELNLFTYPKYCIYFPEEFPQLNSLKTLHIRAPFEGFILKDLTVETLTLNLFDRKSKKGVETIRRITESDSFPVHLKKLQLNFNSKNIIFADFINHKVSEITNLIELTINNNEHCLLNKSFLNLSNLEKLTFYSNYYPLENAEIIAELPNLKEFTVSFHCSENDAKSMKEILQKKGSKAELIVEKLPF